MSFWGELKRRNVVRVAAAYAIVAWLLAQIAGVVFPAYGAPPWVLPVFFSLLIMGFFVALVLSWAYEITPEGVRRTESVPAAEAITRTTGRKLDFVIIAGLVLAIGYLLVDNYGRRSGSENSGAPKIAVLPCANLGDPSNAPFAAGIHEEILHRLAQLRGLRVVARSSVLPFADGDSPIARVAADLGAQAVMECSVRYAGNQILVTAQLIDPATSEHIFSVVENGDLGNVSELFATQAKIALGIAEAVDATYTPAEQARIERGQTTSGEAYKLYLQSTDLGPDRAIGLLRQALEIDSQFAAAHGRLAQIYAFALTNTDDADAVPAAERASVEALALQHADEAIRIDPDTPDGYVALGLTAAAHWRWSEAAAAFARAIERGPYSATAFNTYGVQLSLLGRHDEAIALGERALALDPLDPNAGWYAFQLGYAGRYAEAAGVFERAIAAAPGAVLYRVWLAHMEIARGDSAAAIRSLESAERLAGSTRLTTFLPEWAYDYARAGRPEDAKRIVTEIERAAAGGAEPGAGGWAMAYLAIGDERHALEQLELGADKAARHEPDEGQYALYNLKMNVTNDREVLTKPEFVEVLGRIRGD